MDQTQFADETAAEADVVDETDVFEEDTLLDEEATAHTDKICKNCRNGRCDLCTGCDCPCNG